MPTKQTDPTGTNLPVGRMKSRDHFTVSAFWFGTNLLWGALLMIIIPSQMKQLAPGRPAETAGLLLGMGAIPALVVPLLVGPLSDRCMSKLGRRRPYMIAGTAINLIGLALIWMAGTQLMLWLYFVGYLVNNIGNNIATGSYNGVIPDIVPPDQRGAASGWMAAMSQLGTVVGVFSAALLMNAGRVAESFVVVAFCLVLSLAATVLGVRERPRDTMPDRLDIVGFVKNLWIDPRKHPDFAWVWITRALVVMGLWTMQEYMQFYLVDIVGVPEASKEIITGYVLVISLLCATFTGLIGGGISDRVGRKRVVYVANGTIAAACFAFLLSPSIVYVYFVAAVFGLGFGAYYSVDWALGCDVLPNKDDAGKDMAVWHISMVLPQSIALPLSGALLGAFGRNTTHSVNGLVTHYTMNGYVAIFSLAATFMLLGAVLIRNVKGVR
ncbi:MAG: MFS transporter [Armatimonadota bacterium]